MALRARVARRYSILINVLIGVIIFVNALVNGAANFDLTFLTGKIPADWMKVLAVLKGCAIITAPIAAAGLVIAYSIKKCIGPKPIWDAIHTLLDDFRDKAFRDGSSPHLNRVTLFKYQVCCLKRGAWMKMFFSGKPIWGGWLVPVDRSGDVTQNPKVVFSASRERPDLAEGFVGTIWHGREKQYLHGLPLLN